MSNENSEILKFVLCVLLTQFGKTFQAIRKIMSHFDNDAIKGRSIHMVFTMNTLLNNNQFAKRLKLIENKYGKGSVIIFASKYKGDLYEHIRTLNELKARCANLNECPRVVVMCSNKNRFNNGIKFLRELNNGAILTHVKRVFAYFDELHKYINDILRSQIEEIHGFNCVHEILGLTATPFNVWDSSSFWNNIKMMYFTDFNEEDYCGFNDMNFKILDDFSFENMPSYTQFGNTKSNLITIKFIIHCIEKCPQILAYGSRVFIPGHVHKCSHFKIRDLILKLAPPAIVVVLNGKEKTLTYIDNNEVKSVDVSSSDEEVCTTISNTINRLDLNGRPLVITGFLCVGMGQTLTHQDLGPFTHAIISHTDLTLDDIYQLFGRITGRMRKWINYCKTIVYCPKVSMLRFRVAEHLARNMALCFNDGIASKKDYMAPLLLMGEAGSSALQSIPSPKIIKPMKATSVELDRAIYDFGASEFDNEDDANTFWKSLGGSPHNVKMNATGYYVCAKSKAKEVLTYKQVTDLYSPEKGTNMSKSVTNLVEDRPLIRRYVCYKDITKKIPTFIIRWIKRKRLTNSIV
jgi:hypothetical protein